MRAGLFLCDHVKPEYVDEFGDYPDMFMHLFPEFDFKMYDVCSGQFPQNLDECDLYMTTGSSRSVYEDVDWINRLKEMVREIYRQQKYFIGFCFGHQLMGEALGGKVEKSPKGWCVGVHEFEIGKRKDWMQPFQNKMNLLMMCQDQVVQLPEGAEVLAGNSMCEAGMFQVSDTMLGIQAHPEFSKAYDQRLMEARVERIGTEPVAEGLASLKNELHVDLLRNWLTQHFLLPIKK